MNLVEHFIVETHSEKDDVIEGFVEVEVTVNCYGNIKQGKAFHVQETVGN